MAWILKKSAGSSDPEAWDLVFDGDAAGYAWVPDVLPRPQNGLPSAGDGAMAAAGESTVSVSADGNPVHTAITGTPGADVFVLDLATLVAATAPTPSIVRIDDFSAAQGDVIDVSGVLQASYAPLSAETAQLRVTEDASAASATLDLNAGNPNNPFWIALAELDGVHVGEAVTVALDATHTVQLNAVWLV